MTQHEKNLEAAQKMLAGRLQDLKLFTALQILCDSVNLEWAEMDEDQQVAIVLRMDKEQRDQYKAEGYPGLPEDYGLSLEKYLYNFSTGETTYKYILSTGGPHDEFQYTINERGAITGLKYVSLPWFDRVEFYLYDDNAQIAKDFAERFLYLEAYEPE